MPALNLEGYRLAPVHLTTADEVRESARRVMVQRGRYVAPRAKQPTDNAVDWIAIGQALPDFNFAFPQTDRFREKGNTPVFDPPLIAEIQKAICAAAGITMLEIRSMRRYDRFVVARQIAMALSYRMTGKSYPEIGRNFGGRDHSTAWHAIDKMAPIMSELEPIIETTPLYQLAKMAMKSWDRIRPPSPRVRGATANA